MPTYDPLAAGVSVRLGALKRKTVRLTITIPAKVANKLAARSLTEGRSLSNLSAYLLEAALDALEVQ